MKITIKVVKVCYGFQNGLFVYAVELYKAFKILFDFLFTRSLYKAKYFITYFIILILSYSYYKKKKPSETISKISISFRNIISYQTYPTNPKILQRFFSLE